MADQDSEDRIARRIRERREHAGRNHAKVTPPPAEPTAPSTVPETGLTNEKRAEIRREVESLKDRPVERARRLAQYMAEGLSQGDLALALGVQQPWVSKRVALAKAPIEVLQQIEAGTITENYYYNNRAEIEMQLVGQSRRPLRERPIPVTISLDTARALAEILATLAVQHQAVPIRLDDKATKNEVAEILNLRAGEIRALVVKK